MENKEVAMDKSGEILDYLKKYHNSKEKAINAGKLSTMFNTTKRGLRSIVTELRKNSFPICSGNVGYWYSKDLDDLDETIVRLGAQIYNMEKVVKGLTQAKIQEVKDE